MILKTNVKLNLGLNVLRKRPDGYHDLETLFIPYFGLGDTLEIEQAPAFQISVEPCSWNPLNDLTARAYELLRRDFDLPPVRIRLEKGAPVGAGLGGGSADAAFALRGLSELFDLKLSSEQLAGYAAALGSDCPFFIYNRPMFGSGRGEILDDFDLDLSDYEIRVELPQGISVSTREAYAGLTPRENVETASAGLPLREALKRPVEEWKDLVVNDFETSVFALYPQLASLKASFYERGAVYAAMSGSGSAVFGLWKR